MAGPAIDPVDFFALGRRISHERLLWGIPARGTYVVGVGEALALTGSGPRRFADVAAAWRRLVEASLSESVAEDGAGGPLLVGGFAFDPLRPATPLWDGFPEGRMTVPRLQLHSEDSRRLLTLNVLVDEGTDAAQELSAFQDELQVLGLYDANGRRDGSAAAGNGVQPSETDGSAAEGGLTLTDVNPEAWKQAVETVSALIKERRLEKVVLARRVQARAPHAISVSRALASLRSRYPDCFLFAVARDGRCFLGASPEQLIQVRNREVNIMGLAGTAPRHPDPDEDRRLGEGLLASPKEREEHAVVVRFIRDSVAPFCETMDVPDAPVLRRLHNVQHLFTPIRGRLEDGYTVLDVVQRLHPTPAVGGQPRDEALAVIRDLEELDRGWYAAPVGWVNGAGDGEFAVAIRSALVDGDEASLFSGCGIMGDSKPEAEFEESRVKLRPMIDALTAGVAGGAGG